MSQLTSHYGEFCQVRPHSGWVLAFKKPSAFGWPRVMKQWVPPQTNDSPASKRNTSQSWTWRCRPIIPARRQRQEDQDEFQVIREYIVRQCHKRRKKERKEIHCYHLFCFWQHFLKRSCHMVQMAGVFLPGSPNSLHNEAVSQPSCLVS